MKNLLYLIPVILLIAACTPKVQPLVQATPDKPQLKTFVDSASYIQGMKIYEQLATLNEGGLNMINEEYIRLGIEEAAKGQGRITDEGTKQKILSEFQMQIQKKMQEKQELEGKAAKAVGQAYLAENKSKDGVITTASGLQYKILQEGTGATPSGSDQVEVHYEGRLIDGTVFDSSYQRGSPAQFGITQVIKGWTEGLQLMKEGAKFQFFIPSDLAYGARATGKITPHSVLIFDVELLKIIK